MCHWNTSIPSSANLAAMFSATSCGNPSDPQYFSGRWTPLCHSCFIPNRANLVTDIAYRITNGNSPHGPIGTWDVSLVDNFDELFYGRSTFNDDISSWDSGLGVFLNCVAFFSLHSLPIVSHPMSVLLFYLWSNLHESDCEYNVICLPHAISPRDIF